MRDVKCYIPKIKKRGVEMEEKQNYVNVNKIVGRGFRIRWNEEDNSIGINIGDWVDFYMALNVTTSKKLIMQILKLLIQKSQYSMKELEELGAGIDYAIKEMCPEWHRLAEEHKIPKEDGNVSQTSVQEVRDGTETRKE